MLLSAQRIMYTDKDGCFYVFVFLALRGQKSDYEWLINKGEDAWRGERADDAQLAENV